MRALLLLAGALGCGGDPELDPLRDALSDYDAGRAALEAGDHAAAITAFDRAAEADPGSPALQVWRAQAREAAGQEVEALAVYEAAIARFPRHVELRYNRAALSARRGDIDRAAKDLRFLYARDLLDPMEVGEDADFAPLIEDPDTTLLVPRPQVWLDPTVEDGAVILGASWTLQLTIETPRGPTPSLSDMGSPSGLLRHVRTVEDVLDIGPRTERRQLKAEFLAVAPGRGSLGPWLVAAGGTSALTGRFPVEVVSLPGRGEQPPPREGAAQLPSALLAGLGPPHAGAVEAGLVAIGEAGDRLRCLDAAGAEVAELPVELELREAGQVQWLARLWPAEVGCRPQVLRKGLLIAGDEAAAPPGGSAAG